MDKLHSKKFIEIYNTNTDHKFFNSSKVYKEILMKSQNLTRNIVQDTSNLISIHLSSAIAVAANSKPDAVPNPCAIRRKSWSDADSLRLIRNAILAKS